MPLGSSSEAPVISPGPRRASQLRDVTFDDHRATRDDSVRTPLGRVEYATRLSASTLAPCPPLRRLRSRFRLGRRCGAIGSGVPSPEYPTCPTCLPAAPPAHAGGLTL